MSFAVVGRDLPGKRGQRVVRDRRCVHLELIDIAGHCLKLMLML
jgi:hypothetical protein